MYCVPQEATHQKIAASRTWELGTHLYPSPPDFHSYAINFREGEDVTVGELRVSPWLTAPGMEHEQLGRRGLSASQPMAERD